jgi:broad specificity polyphosphatase/5'/3'-nucleotidase SurE
MGALKQEVLRPLVTSGVKEGHNLAADWIHAGEIRALLEIAAMAGKRKIVHVVTPAVLPGNDMLDVVCELAMLLAQQAVLATVVRSPPNEVLHASVHR